MWVFCSLELFSLLFWIVSLFLLKFGHCCGMQRCPFVKRKRRVEMHMKATRWEMLKYNVWSRRTHRIGSSVYDAVYLFGCRLGNGVYLGELRRAK